MFRDTETYTCTSIYIRQNLTKTWRMRMQLLPGLIFAGSDIKAKIRPGLEARTLPDLDPGGEQPKTDGTAEIYALFYLHMQNLKF